MKKIKDNKTFDAGSFSDLMFKGMPIIRDEEPMTTGIAYLRHLYASNWFGSKKRHICLKNGWWCFQNFREHPQDLLGFLRAKFDKMEK